MKKFRFASDLHLEFAYGDPSFLKPKDSNEVKAKAFADYADKLLPPHEDDGATVLILPGDICDNWRAHTRFHGFWQRVSERFAEVVWLPGNHEYYGHYFSDVYDARVAINMAQEFGNVFYWNRNTANYKVGERNVHLIVATLWSDCNKGDPLSTYAISQGLNDYNHITFADKELDIYRKLRVADVMAEHCKSRDYIVEKVKLLKARDPNCFIIVATHHAPSYQSIPERYQGDQLSHAYASDLDWYAFGEHLPDVWLHGHIHDTVSYQIDTMTVVSNPYGYPGHYHNADYAHDAQIVVEE